MSKWREVKLGKIVSFTTGKLNSNAAVEGGKYPFYTCSQTIFKTNTFSFDTECIILGGNNANAKYPLFYKKGKFDAYQRNYIIEPKDKNELNIKFLYYYMRLRLEYMRVASTGVTTKFLTLKILKNMRFQIPDLKTQEKIADLLSAYDELIENNNRRIEILEKTAEEIYKEWFVRMRFPGHEKAKFIKGIPEGWEVKKIGNIITKLESGKRQKSNNEEEKTVVSLGAGDIKGLGEYSNSNEYLIPYTFFKEMNKGVVEDKDIAIYKDGAYTGKTTMFRDQFPYSEIAVNEHVFLVQCKDYKLQNYLLFTLMQNSYFDLMQILSMTSAQPGLNQSKFKNIKIEVPTKNLIDEFHGISEIHLKEIFNLAKQNQNLIKQRDLLLPRLMNGTIEVK